MTKSPEVKLWIGVIETIVDDALGKFKIPNNRIGSLDEQYSQMRLDLLLRKPRLSIRRRLYATTKTCGTEVERARHFMEDEKLDDIVKMSGYDTLFVSKAFAFVQKAITLEKKLWDEFKHPDLKEGSC